MSELPTESVPKSVEPAYLAIVELTDAVCDDNLNDDYAGVPFENGLIPYIPADRDGGK